MVFQNIFQGIITELACRPFNSLLNKNAFYNIRNNRIIHSLLRNPLGTPRYGMNKHLNSLISYNITILNRFERSINNWWIRNSAHGFQSNANQSKSARSPVLEFIETFLARPMNTNYSFWVIICGFYFYRFMDRGSKPEGRNSRMILLEESSLD